MNRIMQAILGLFAASALVAPSLAVLPPAPAGVQVSHEYGIEFVTIGDAGNSGFPNSTVGWTGDDDRLGRGSVNHEYRIARTEVTSGQWLEFLNTFGPRPMPDSVRTLFDPFGGLSEFYVGPSWFGGVVAEDNHAQQTARYELRTDVPNAENIPVSGLSWRIAAAYCNWLHHGKSNDWDSLLSGAYDTSTWGTDPITGSFNDSIVHEPDARFWIPTLDEWGKAAFYDPNRHGQGEGGWWDRHYSMNEPPTPGLPGEPGAQSSTGIPVLSYTGVARDIPLAAYASMSPWGLFDTAGGTSEIVGEYSSSFDTVHHSVLTLGSIAGTSTLDPEFLPILLANATQAFAGGTTGFYLGDPSRGLRIAAAVPSPSAFCACGSILGLIMFSRQRITA